MGKNDSEIIGRLLDILENQKPLEESIEKLSNNINELAVRLSKLEAYYDAKLERVLKEEIGPLVEKMRDEVRKGTMADIIRLPNMVKETLQKALETLPPNVQNQVLSVLKNPTPTPS